MVGVGDQAKKHSLHEEIERRAMEAKASNHVGGHLAPTTRFCCRWLINGGEFERGMQLYMEQSGKWAE